MKKNLLFGTLILCGAINAQTTLTQANHAPVNGDMYGTKQCDSTGITPGGSGASVLWNYATLNIRNQAIFANNYTVTTSSNASFNPANVKAAPNSSNSAYYLASAGDLKYYGGDMVVSGQVATIGYTVPAVVAKYPMALNTFTGSTTSGTLSVIGQSGTFSGNCYVVADGTGTIALPGKTFTATTRVVTTQSLSYSAGSFVNGTISQLTYDYYSIGNFKTPVFTISSSTITSSLGPPTTQTLVTVNKNYLVVTGINENTNTITDLSVYPNPTTDFITLKTQNNAAKAVNVYDLTGKKLTTYLFENGESSFSTLNLVSGIYFYEIKDNANQSLSNGKFAVSH